MGFPAMRTAVLCLFACAVAVSCSDEAGVEGSEAQLDEAYLEPLASSGLTYEVAEVCHYPRLGDGEPWHFEVELSIDADRDEVADALAGEVGVIQRDRDPIIVQQFPGEPGRGWNGSITEAGGVTTLGLVKNNVQVDGDRPDPGWLQVCNPND